MYNGIGNIVSVKAYGYTPAGTELSGTPRKSEAFTYGDTANPDRLTSFKGKSITYNANGGVATYDGCDYTWNKGKLSTIYRALGGSSRAILPTLQSSQTYSFGYNGLGQRVSSSYNYVNISSSSLQKGELTAYNKKFSYDHSGRLIYETNTKTYYQEGSETYEIVYLYDNSGVVGMAYIKNGVTSAYYFQKNLMGDVVAIYDTNGAKIASYNYDAWGNCTIASNTTNYTIAHANPFRYRSYYYDEDTKLYYLKARYYSPEFRRFISPDDTNYLDPENANGCNLYTYCGNNPIINVDPSGCSWYNVAWDWANTVLGFLNPISTTIAIGNIIVASLDGRWGDVVDDWNNGCLNVFNQSDSTALKAKVVGFYKGSTMVRHNLGGTFSILGTIWAEPSITNITLKHEYGHSVQERLLSFPAYLVVVAIPSAFNCHFGRYLHETNGIIRERMYFSKIWERTADFLGGVNRGNYDPLWNINNFIPW